jgi:hypothetical protein
MALERPSDDNRELFAHRLPSRALPGFVDLSPETSKVDGKRRVAAAREALEQTKQAS